MPWILLTVFHVFLFRKFYVQNPYVYASSELLEQGFITFLRLGRSLRRGRFPSVDVYYHDVRVFPFLQTFYPPVVATAWLSTFLTLNQAWVLYSFMMVAHFWLSSVSVYILATAMGLAPLPAGFASVTLSSAGYALKQNSAICSTAAWVPIWLLSLQAGNWLLAGISLGMLWLAGYWPISLPVTLLGGLPWHLIR